jgi:hypothetical protein
VALVVYEFRRHDPAGAEGHCDQEAEAVGLLRDEPRLLSALARLRQRHRCRHDHVGLRAATVVDAFSLNYRIILAEEGCVDRSEACHNLRLCGINAKYAGVVPTAEVLSYFDQLPAGLFDLPVGTESTVPIKDAAE